MSTTKLHRLSTDVNGILGWPIPHYLLALRAPGLYTKKNKSILWAGRVHRLTCRASRPAGAAVGFCHLPKIGSPHTPISASSHLMQNKSLYDAVADVATPPTPKLVYGNGLISCAKAPGNVQDTPTPPAYPGGSEVPSRAYSLNMLFHKAFLCYFFNL